MITPLVEITVYVRNFSMIIIINIEKMHSDILNKTLLNFSDIKLLGIRLLINPVNEW